MTEAWVYIDGVKVSIPLDPCDAMRYGWHKGTEIRQWYYPKVSINDEINREIEINDWCRKTFAQTRYRIFHNSVYFYYERDALLCRLRWP